MQEAHRVLLRFGTAHRKLLKAAAVLLAAISRPSLLPAQCPKKWETANEHPQSSRTVQVTFWSLRAGWYRNLKAEIMWIIN